MPFRDRAEAGRRLAEALGEYAGRDDVVLLGLARGGVEVAAAAGEELGVPVDVFLVRKLGVPGREELAMGAIADGGVRVLNDDIVAAVGVPSDALERVAERERAELERRARTYRGDRPPPELEGRTAILVDDGLATGATMEAAVRAARQLGPTRLVVAVPTGAAEARDRIAGLADEVICLETPRPFHGVGAWYRDFRQTTDEDVRRLLAEPFAS